MEKYRQARMFRRLLVVSFAAIGFFTIGQEITRAQEFRFDQGQTRWNQPQWFDNSSQSKAWRLGDVDLQNTNTGVRVLDIDPNPTASRSGLRKGDMIITV
ncbi:MAG TPA: hypothetical protein PKA76_04535, partial [Pirellulaceae bacterium]|nr:hypothetical protein [Pirellulaceae bacterium]